MPPAKSYENGVRDGKTEATLDDVLVDIAELKKLITHKMLWHVAGNSVAIGFLTVALGFLYVATIRGWL